MTRLAEFGVALILMQPANIAWLKCSSTHVPNLTGKLCITEKQLFSQFGATAVCSDILEDRVVLKAGMPDTRKPGMPE